MISIPDHCRKSPIVAIFLATRGQKNGQRDLISIYFWRLAQSVHTSSMKWIEWSVFQITVRLHQYWSHFPAARGPKFSECCTNPKLFLNTQLASLYNTYEVHWIISIPDNGWKLSIAAFFRPPQSRKLENAAKYEKSCFFSDSECFLKNYDISPGEVWWTGGRTWGVYKADLLSWKSYFLCIYWINLAQDHNIKSVMMFNVTWFHSTR